VPRDQQTPSQHSRAGTSAVARFGPWLREHIDDFDAVVFDVDGVLMTARRPTPGSIELVEWLRETGFPFALLTNDGCHSPEEKTGFLAQCGMDFRVDEIVSASHGLETLVSSRGWRGKRVFVLGELGTPCYAQRAGLEVTREPRAIGDCVAVVVGERDYDWQKAVEAAFNFLRQEAEAELIVPNPDDCFPGSNGRLHVASGAIGRFIVRLCSEHGRDIEPVFLGKPFLPIFESNHRRIEKQLGRRVQRERVIIVGDSLSSDIAGGNGFGYRTGLVWGGITTPAMLHASSVRPWRVFGGL